MPIISNFYGIIIRMYYRDNQQHKVPHLHASYAEYTGIFDLKGKMIDGKMPLKKRKIIEAWIIIHKEELETLWTIMVNGTGYFNIEPLK